MSQRLYYDDPYRVRFAARVVERLEWEGRPAVVLDRSAFYPTGGGQPHDTGRLGGVDVLDVAEREADGAVVHVLAAPLAGDEAEGEVNWARRFDLMQQHTGQHILSAIFLERFGANTVGFHLSGDYATIDLDRAPFTPEDLAGAEDLANEVVFADHPVAARFVADEEVAGLPLRKPLAHEGPVRIVEIPDLDCSACGGTHVRASGEIGLIKITHSERRGDETRVEFLCGGRALADYRAKNDMVMDLARDFTVGHWELDEMVHRLSVELKETRRALRTTRDALLDAEAVRLWHEGQDLAGARVVRACLAGRSPDDLKHLAQRLVDRPATIVLLGGVDEAGEKGYFTFARSADLDHHMGKLVRQACQVIGGGGGGRPEFAQGGGPRGDKVGQALDLAFQTLAGSPAAGDGA
ncbi:MAG: DHHA1 domain-containing protein [Anaerolineae bacterium]|jgi:alanyl-tRNA synthetase